MTSPPPAPTSSRPSTRPPQQVKTLTDKGYQGAGIGILHPVKGQGLAPDTTARNRLITGLRAPAERANVILKHFRALQKVTLDPWRITQIVRSALVIATAMRGAW